jgi:hypothetical protein
MVVLPQPKLLPPSNCPITRAAYERIRREVRRADVDAIVGFFLPPSRPFLRREMKRADIEAILGGPPGDYRTRPVELDTDEMIWAYNITRILEWTQVEWLGDEGAIWGRFYSDGTVHEVLFIRANGTPEP